MKKICAFFLMLLLIEDCLAENNIFRLDERPEPSFEVSEESSYNFLLWSSFCQEDFSSGTRAIWDVDTSKDKVAILFTPSDVAQHTGQNIDKSWLLNVYDSSGKYLYGYALRFRYLIERSKILFYGDDVLLYVYNADRIYRFSDSNSFMLYRIIGQEMNESQEDKLKILQRTRHSLSITTPKEESVVIVDYNEEYKQLYQLTEQSRIAFTIVGILILLCIIFTMVDKYRRKCTEKQKNNAR